MNTLDVAKNKDRLETGTIHPMTNPRRITRRAYAKINLALSVGPAEPVGTANAGMHPITSWMHAIDLFDDVSIEAVEGQSQYEIDWAADAPRPSEIDWPVEKDLVVRAHRLLEERAGRALPVKMSVSKRIPVGGGLGGGSSDAAAVFIAVNELFELGFSLSELAQMSAALGSDIAFFIDDSPARAAIVSGFGDQIERIAPSESGLVLLLPGFGCATGAVYGSYDAIGPRHLKSEQVESIARSGSIVPLELSNDLAAPAEFVEPKLARLRREAERAIEVPVHITGSGSAMFVVTDSPRDVAQHIETEVSGLTCVVTRLVG